MKEITIDGITYTLTPKEEFKEKFTYPMWFYNYNSGIVVKFTNLNKGEVVFLGENKMYTLGQKISGLVPHTQTDTWEQIEDPNKLQDKDAVMCWDDKQTHVRTMKFFDAINNDTFSYTGKRDGLAYQNYEKIPRDEEPSWMTEARKTLQD